MIPRIVTERLVLRGPVAADFEPIRALLMSERAEYMGGPFTLEQAWKEFCMDVAGWMINGHGGWSIEARSGGFVGMVALTERPDFPERELGWMLLPEAEGKGYAVEAACAARAHAYGPLGWPTVVSYISPENARSIALAERLGATRDDTAEPPEPGDLVYRHPAPETLQ